MKTKLLVLILISLFVQGAAAWATSSPEFELPSRIEASVTPEQVTLGQPFEYRLVLEHAQDFRFELRPPQKTGVFEILETQRERQDQPGKSTTTFQIKMAVFDLGKHDVPALTLEVWQAGQRFEWAAPIRSVECVATLAEDAAQQGEALADIRPPEELPVRSLRLFLIVLGGILAIVCLGWLFRFWKKRRRKPAQSLPALSLKEKVLKKLDALSAKKLPEQKQIREFHFLLSEILRSYLGERFAFDAMECTSAELMETLKKRQVLTLHQEQMQQFVLQADLARYAKSPVSVEDCHRAFAFVYQLVSDTA